MKLQEKDSTESFERMVQEQKQREQENLEYEQKMKKQFEKNSKKRVMRKF